MAYRTTPHRERQNEMSKSALAQQYFPTRCPRSAVNGLAMYIERCRNLSDALAGAGYNRRQRLLTPAQVALIYDYLGEP